MAGSVRTVRVRPRLVGEETLLAIDEGDRRSFAFGERVVVLGERDGEERIGVVSWDPVARWVVRIEERGSRLVPW